MADEETRPLITNPSHTQEGWHQRTRAQFRRFLSSKSGHYSVLAMVGVDVSCIFADFMISLFRCERECKGHGESAKDLAVAQEALGIVSLVFSCLFMFELVLSIWSYGFKFFRSKFHCFDALVICASFVIDVCLKGVIEEIGSVIVVLRLFRILKIVDELSAGAEDRMEALTDALADKIKRLEDENHELRRRVGRK